MSVFPTSPPFAMRADASRTYSREVGERTSTYEGREHTAPGPEALGLVAVATRRELAHQLGEVDAEKRPRDGASFGRGPRHSLGELGRTARVDDCQVVDVAERSRRLADDRRNERQRLEQDRGLVELAVGVGEKLLRSRLGLSAGEDRRALSLSDELDLLRLRLGCEDGGLSRTLGADDRRLALGLGRADRGRDELLGAALRLELLRVGLRLRGDPLGIGARDLAVPLGGNDDALGLVLLDRGLLRRARLRDPRVADDTREVLLPELLDVALRIADARDRERVDVDAARLEVAARGLGDGLLEPIAVGDELLDRQRAGDRAKRALEDLLDHGLDLAVRFADEPLGRRAKPLGLAGDLEHRLSGDEHPDPLLRDRLVLVGQPYLDLARRELEPPDLVEERPHERARADDDLDALIACGDQLALLIADLRTARS